MASLQPFRPREVHQVLVSHLVGGAGLIAIGLAEAVKARGVESQGWVPGRGPASDALDARQIRWHRYSLAGLQRGGSSQVAALVPFAGRLTRPWRPLVHVHNPTVYGYISPILRFAGARLAVQFHIDPTREEMLWALRHAPGAVIACSRHIASQVTQMNAEVGRNIPVFAVPNAVDIERYSAGDTAQAKRRVGASADRPLLIMLANLAPHKGQLTALRTVSTLKDRGIDVDCWLAGEERGSEKRFTSELEAAARDLGIGDQVRFLGFRTDGPDLLRAADFFLLPSTHEGLPLSILEAQSAGAVVLGSPIPGIREVVTDGETGFLLDPADPAAYATRVAQVIGDCDLRHRVVGAAAAHVRREYSWTQYVERTWQVYESLA